VVSTPVKNDGVRQLGFLFPTEWKVIKHVPNHQPGIHQLYPEKYPPPNNPTTGAAPPGPPWRPTRAAACAHHATLPAALWGREVWMAGLGAPWFIGLIGLLVVCYD